MFDPSTKNISVRLKKDPRIENERDKNKPLNSL
jgi:hypothetical protein